MRRLFLVTHAQSLHQVEGLTGGWYDTGLTDLGRWQAERIALELQRQNGGAPVALFTSDLLRAAETAQVIALQLAVKPVVMPHLRELGHGAAEGRSRSWLEQHGNPLPPPEARFNHRLCTGAESFGECAQRIYAAVEEISRSSQANLIVVSHSFVLTYLIDAWLRIPLKRLSHRTLAAVPAGLSLLQEAKKGRRSLIYLSRTSHLSDHPVEQAAF